MANRVRVVDMMPLEKAFHLRTASIYSGMVKRFTEKWSKNGRRLRIGIVVPFDLEQFRAWVLFELGGRPDGCTKCHYCNRPLCSEDFQVEHKMPVKRGGSPGFENLELACQECNRAKGGLTDTEYQALRDSLDVLLATGKLLPDGYKDIWKRLKGETLRIDAWRRAQKPAQVQTAPQPVQDDFF